MPCSSLDSVSPCASSLTDQVVPMLRPTSSCNAGRTRDGTPQLPGELIELSWNVEAINLVASLVPVTAATPRTQRRSSTGAASPAAASSSGLRSEEHTSELQSQSNLVCRLLLE